ncbi:helix-turn-helix domain-containing protein [Paenibacillus sp. P26]|nr:helix-turn-helix domain-containing protein [Paenibacillus sp. P26]UUZ90986.1 helix-turn-helix domain-containing protein [Paenibacillus sp. P25]
MEEEKSGEHEAADHLEGILKRAQAGDKESMELIVKYFEDEINRLAKYIKLPREDAVQTLKLELIEYILRKNGDSG